MNVLLEGINHYKLSTTPYDPKYLPGINFQIFYYAFCDTVQGHDAGSCLAIATLISFVLTIRGTRLITYIRSRVQNFRPGQLFKVTEIKQLCYFST
jgi:hypothetical protein